MVMLGITLLDDDQYTDSLNPTKTEQRVTKERGQEGKKTPSYPSGDSPF